MRFSLSDDAQALSLPEFEHELDVCRPAQSEGKNSLGKQSPFAQGKNQYFLNSRGLCASTFPRLKRRNHRAIL